MKLFLEFEEQLITIGRVFTLPHQHHHPSPAGEEGRVEALGDWLYWAWKDAVEGTGESGIAIAMHLVKAVSKAE